MENSSFVPSTQHISDKYNVGTMSFVASIRYIISLSTITYYIGVYTYIYRIPCCRIYFPNEFTSKILDNIQLSGRKCACACGVRFGFMLDVCNDSGATRAHAKPFKCIFFVWKNSTKYN